MWLWLKLKCSEQHFISWLWYNIGSLYSETFSKLNKTKTGSLFASIHISSGLWHPIKTANKAVLQYITHLTCWAVTPQPLVCEIAAGEVTRTSCSCHVSCSIILCSSLDVTCHDPAAVTCQAASRAVTCHAASPHTCQCEGVMWWHRSDVWCPVAPIKILTPRSHNNAGQYRLQQRQPDRQKTRMIIVFIKQ